MPYRQSTSASSDLIQRKYNLKIKKYISAKKIAQDYGQAIFELMNEAYQPSTVILH